MSEGEYSSHHPAFNVPKNPWDYRRFTRVSSSGSGVATAAGLSFGCLGTDTGGSIRFPSAANGIVGLKPPYVGYVISNNRCTQAKDWCVSELKIHDVHL